MKPISGGRVMLDERRCLMVRSGLGFSLIADGNGKQKRSSVSRFPQTGQYVRQFCFLVPLPFVFSD